MSGTTVATLLLDPQTQHTSNRSTDPNSRSNHTPSYGTHPTHNEGNLGGSSTSHTVHNVHNTDRHNYRDRAATHSPRTAHTHPTQK